MILYMLSTLNGDIQSIYAAFTKFFNHYVLSTLNVISKHSQPLKFQQLHH